MPLIAVIVVWLFVTLTLVVTVFLALIVSAALVPGIILTIVTAPFAMVWMMRVCIISFFAAIAYHHLVMLPLVSCIFLPVPVMVYPGIALIDNHFMCTV